MCKRSRVERALASETARAVQAAAGDGRRRRPALSSQWGAPVMLTSGAYTIALHARRALISGSRRAPVAMGPPHRAWPPDLQLGAVRVPAGSAMAAILWGRCVGGEGALAQTCVHAVHACRTCKLSTTEGDAQAACSRRLVGVLGSAATQAIRCARNTHVPRRNARACNVLWMAGCAAATSAGLSHSVASPPAPAPWHARSSTALAPAASLRFGLSTSVSLTIEWPKNVQAGAPQHGCCWLWLARRNQWGNRGTGGYGQTQASECKAKGKEEWDDANG